MLDPQHGPIAAARGPLERSRPLAGRVALVTGAGRGIGATLAAGWARAGAAIACLDRDGDAAEATATTLRDAGATVAQGFLVARPMPAGDLAGWAAAWAADRPAWAVAGGVRA